MLRRIKLYGPLAKFIGHRVLMAAVETPAEAVRYLIANWPEVQRHMAESSYRIMVGRNDLPVDTDPEQLHYPVGQDDIRIVPVVAGAGGTARIIAGVALVALAFAGGAQVFGVAFAKNALLFQVAGSIGFSLALGGIAQLLTPLPQTPKDESDPRKSYSFSGIQNTARQGTPVPIIYGETIVGSVVISAAIDIV